MNSVAISAVSALCVVVGALFGQQLRRKLPEAELTQEAKDVVKVGAGMLATLTALVLSLLVSSAKGRWDSMGEGVAEHGAKVVLLDRALSRFGPETAEVRRLLREAVVAGVERVWPDGGARAGDLGAVARASNPDAVDDGIRALLPKDERQREFRAEALAVSADLRATRWRMIERYHTPMPAALLVALDAWLAVFFLSVGLLASRSRTVLGVLAVTGLCISSAVFVMLELNRPFAGLIRVSPAPLLAAIEHLGR